MAKKFVSKSAEPSLNRGERFFKPEIDSELAEFLLRLLVIAHTTIPFTTSSPASVMNAKYLIHTCPDLDFPILHTIILNFLSREIRALSRIRMAVMGSSFLGSSGFFDNKEACGDSFFDFWRLERRKPFPEKLTGKVVRDVFLKVARAAETFKSRAAAAPPISNWEDIWDGLIVGALDEALKENLLPEEGWRAMSLMHTPRSMA